MDKIAIYCKSYVGDFERVKVLVESIHKFNVDKILTYISVPNKDTQLFSQISGNGVTIIEDEDIYNIVKGKTPGISIATVYKTLETFVTVGLANKVMNHKGNLRYDGFTQQHHHIYCLNTEEIIDFEDPELENYIKQYFKDKNISNIDIEKINIQVHGNKINTSKKISIN